MFSPLIVPNNSTLDYNILYFLYLNECNKPTKYTVGFNNCVDLTWNDPSVPLFCNATYFMYELVMCALDVPMRNKIRI